MKFLIACVIISVPLAVLAGPISVNFDPPSVVFDAISQGLSQWADEPLGSCPGTADGECCTGTALDQECQVVAAKFRTSRDTWTRRTYTCLRGSSNWECELWTDSHGTQQMGCETVPSTESVILADVATCISSEAVLP